MHKIKDISESDALKLVEFLEDVNYSLINENFIDVSTFFPPFSQLHKKISKFNEPYQLFLSLFRLGHLIDSTIIREFIPPPILSIMIDAGLLVVNGTDICTNGIALISYKGMYFIVPLSAAYPTGSESFHFDDPDILVNDLNYNTIKSSKIDPKQIFDHSPSSYGMLSITLLKEYDNCISYVHSVNDDYTSFVRFSANLNAVSSRIKFLEEVNRDINYDLVIINDGPVYHNLFAQKKYIHFGGWDQKLPSFNLSDHGIILFNFTLIGLSDQIEGLKDWVTVLQDNDSCFCKIIVFDKIPANVFFDSNLRRLKCGDWEELAGISESYYMKNWWNWLALLEVDKGLENKNIYGLQMTITKKKPLIRFSTLYNPTETDLLYSLSQRNT